MRQASGSPPSSASVTSMPASGTRSRGAISPEFNFPGEKGLLANRARGIFRPRQMSWALSVKTTVPREGQGRRRDGSSLDVQDLMG